MRTLLVTRRRKSREDDFGRLLYPILLLEHGWAFACSPSELAIESCVVAQKFTERTAMITLTLLCLKESESNSRTLDTHVTHLILLYEIDGRLILQHSGERDEPRRSSPD